MATGFGAAIGFVLGLVIIVAMMLFRPTGLIPERRHAIELEEGVHDTPFFDVQTEGTLTDRDPSDD